MTARRRILVILVGGLLIALGVWSLEFGKGLQDSAPGAGTNNLPAQPLRTETVALDRVLRVLGEESRKAEDSAVHLAIYVSKATTQSADGSAETKPKPELTNFSTWPSVSEQNIGGAITETETLKETVASAVEATSVAQDSERDVHKAASGQLVTLGAANVLLGLIVLLLGLLPISPRATPAPAPTTERPSPAAGAAANVASFKQITALENVLNRLFFAATNKTTAASVSGLASSLAQDVRDSLRSAGLSITPPDPGVSSLLQRLEEAAASPGPGNVPEFARGVLEDLQRDLRVRYEGLHSTTFIASAFERTKAFLPIEQVAEGGAIELVSPAWYVDRSVAIKGRFRRRSS